MNSNNKKNQIETLELPIQGLERADSAQKLESTLRGINGIIKGIVNFKTKKIFIQFNPKEITSNKIIKAIKQEGFETGSSQISFGIKGIFCSSCVLQIENTLKDTEGVLEATVNIGTGQVYVEYLPWKTDLSKIQKAVESTGYKTIGIGESIEEDTEKKEHEMEYRSLMRKFYFAAIISVPVMILGYPSWFPYLKDLTMETIRHIWLGLGIITIPVLAWSGRNFFTGAISAFKHRSAVFARDTSH